MKLTKRQEKAFTRYLFHQRFISEGTGRLVYGYGDTLVIKVAKNKSGYEQNKNEVERFKKYGDSKLARIYAYSRKIVIMERVKPVCLNKWNKIAEWLDGITGFVSEDHLSQGYRNGTRKLVAYDYGDGKHTYTKRIRHDYTIREIVLGKGVENDNDRHSGKIG